MRLKKITPIQKRLLEHIDLLKDKTEIFEYDDMKKLSIKKFKSFDSTFNALLHKGYVKRFIAAGNKFITITFKS